MSDPYGKHYCEQADVNEMGGCFCKFLSGTVSCMGYSEDCEIEFPEKGEKK